MPRCKFAAWLAQPPSRVAVVGASGWVGMALVDQILAAGLTPDRLRLFGSQAQPLSLRNQALSVEPLGTAPPLGAGEWLVLHAGVIGADRVEGGDLAEVRRRNDAMLRQVLSLAETGEARRLVLTSSGAARHPDAGAPAKQAYARMKRDHELDAAAWAARTGRTLLIPRIFSLGGPYINHVPAYALGDFIVQCATAGAIVIGADVPVVRSFVHVLDAARGILDMAVDEAETEAPFDVCLGRPVELQELAEAVAAALGKTALIERPPIKDTVGDVYVGEGGRFQRAVARRAEPPASLDVIIADTIAYLRSVGALGLIAPGRS